MRGLEKDSARVFNCALCHLQVFVCRSCDRGQLYCQCCSKIAHQRAIRSAKQRYQQTCGGRLKHAERQRRYRLKNKLLQKVTYSGSPPQRAHDELPITVKEPANNPQKCICHFCGHVCGAWLRHDFLKTSVLKRESWLRSGP